MKSRLRIPILFLLIVLAMGPTQIAWADDLGQVVDDFEDEGLVSVKDNVSRNSTLDCMELNYSFTLKVYEDFENNYTETDGTNRLTQSGHQSNFTTLFRGDDNTHLHRDFGVGFFSDFFHEFEIYIDDITNQAVDSMVHGVIIYDDALNDWSGNRGNSIDQLGIITMVTGDESGYHFQVRFSNGGADTRTNGDYEFSEDTRYYCSFNKTGKVVSLLVYDDAIRTNELENVTHTCSVDDSYRYINAPMSLDYPLAVSSGTGFIENLWLGNTTGGYESNGYFITVNYLDYAEGSSLALLTNSTIYSGTQLSTQFSKDNITWVNNLNSTGSNVLESGLYSLDLRTINFQDIFIRYIFNGSVSYTPQLFQSWLITTQGENGAVTTEDPTPWLAIGLILVAAMALLMDRARN